MSESNSTNIGSIKFFDSIKGYGFIIPSTGGKDIFLHMSALPNNCPQPRNDSEVKFDITSETGRTEARNILVIDAAVEEENLLPTQLGPRKDWLTNWAFIPLRDIENRNGGRFDSALTSLEAMALDRKEYWRSRRHIYPNDPVILRSYLRYTFVRLCEEQKIAISADREFASFNTGLVNRHFRPIYAIFVRNRGRSAPWKYRGFCVPQIGELGKKLTEVFDPLPARAEYFTDPRDIVLDPKKDIYLQHDHILEDGIARARFPMPFLRHNAPRDFTWREADEMSEEEKVTFLSKLLTAIRSDDQCYRTLIARLQDALNVAKMRVEWNGSVAQRA